MATVSRGGYSYTSRYCEENVWMMAKQLLALESNADARCYAIFISNRQKTVAMYAVAGHPKGIVWDYHVVFAMDVNGALHIFDLDTSLPLPCPLAKYAMDSFRPREQTARKLAPVFRVVPGREFLATFASDRSHMLDSKGVWSSPPPSYPCIATQCKAWV